MEVCEACSTVNLSAARLFYRCHKLPQFYEARSYDKTIPQARVVPERTLAWRLAAFCLVTTSLAIMTTRGLIA